MHGQSENVFWRRTSGPEAETSDVGRLLDERAAGPGVVAAGGRRAEAARAYGGVVCLTAEYSDTEAVNRLVIQDLAFAKSLL